MIRISRLAVCLVALGTLGAVPASHAACTYPKAPGQMPDGKSATKEEMIAAQTAVKQFIADVDVYLKCVDDESGPAADPAKLTKEQIDAQNARERLRTQKHNAAVADEEAVRDRFNEQLHAYNDAHKK